MFNSDAITSVNQTFTATRLADGSWVADSPVTPKVEVNNWGNVTGIVNPRFMRMSLTATF